MNPELVLVVGDMFVPQRSPDISDQFKSILIPNKLQHVLSLGNIGSRESNDWLKSLSNDFHQVKGDYDEGDIPEKKVVQIGEFKIGIFYYQHILIKSRYVQRKESSLLTQGQFRVPFLTLCQTQPLRLCLWCSREKKLLCICMC